MVTIQGNSLVGKSTVPATASYAPFVIGTDGLVDYMSEPALVDLSKLGRWEDGSYNTVTTLDANGYPTSFPSGTHNKLYFAGTTAFYHPMQLTFHCATDPSLVFHTGTGSYTYDSGTGVGVASVTPTTAGTLEIQFFALPTYVQLIRTDAYSDGTYAADLLAAGVMLSPDYTQHFKIGTKPFAAIRTMDYCKVNNNTTTTTTPVSLDYASWRTAPPEPVADIANQTGAKHVWCNMLINGTSAYRQSYFTRLKAKLNSSTVVIIEFGNENWNTQFSQTKALLGNSIIRYATAGVSGTYQSTNATITSNTITLQAGEGANVLAALGGSITSSSIVAINGRGHDNSWTLSGDTVTLAGADTFDEAPGSGYTISFGDWSMHESGWVESLYDVYLDAMAVWGDRTKFKIVLAAQQGNTTQVGRFFNRVQWLASNPSAPAIDTFVDFYAESSYFGASTVTDAIANQYLGGDTTGGLAALQTALLATSPIFPTVRAALDTYAPTMPLLAYEGGSHMQHSAMHTGTYTVAQCVALTQAWRADASLVYPVLEAWINQQKTNMYWGCQYQALDLFDQYGEFGLNGPSGTTKDAYGDRVTKIFDALTQADMWV